jgi:hypothetical protein
MADAGQFLSISIPTLAVLIGVLVNNSRIRDLRVHTDERFNAVDQRFSDLDSLFTRRLLSLEQVFDARSKISNAATKP